MRSISTPPRKGTTRPGRVTTITCQLTATVECVADMMYQLTPMKFIPLPNSDTNMAVKKKRKERCSHSNPQSTRCVVAVAIEPTSLLSDCCPSMKRETEILGREQVAAGSPGRQPSISSKCPQTEDGRCVFPINSSACQGLRGAHGEAIESFCRVYRIRRQILENVYHSGFDSRVGELLQRRELTVAMLSLALTPTHRHRPRADPPSEACRCGRTRLGP